MAGMVGKHKLVNTHLGQFVDITGCSQRAAGIDVNSDFASGPVAYVV